MSVVRVVRVVPVPFSNDIVVIPIYSVVGSAIAICSRQQASVIVYKQSIGIGCAICISIMVVLNSATYTFSRRREKTDCALW